MLIYNNGKVPLFPDPNPPTPEEPMPRNIGDLAAIVCTICADNPNYQRVLNCGHVFCRSCVHRPNFRNCPICRVPITRIGPVHTGSLTIVSKEDAENGFGAREEQMDHALDGRRPGDLTAEEEIAIRNQEMIADMIAEEMRAGEIMIFLASLQYHCLIV